MGARQGSATWERWRQQWRALKSALEGRSVFRRPSKAAALMESIIQRHPFVDGNKRTGLKSGVFFLFLEGYELTPSPQELTNITLEVAEHRLDVDGLARWLEEHARPRLGA